MVGQMKYRCREWIESEAKKVLNRKIKNKINIIFEFFKVFRFDSLQVVILNGIERCTY